MGVSANYLVGKDVALGGAPNQSLQQTKPSVTVRACARPAPAVFAAEAGVMWSGWARGLGDDLCDLLLGHSQCQERLKE